MPDLKIGISVDTGNSAAKVEDVSNEIEQLKVEATTTAAALDKIPAGLNNVTKSLAATAIAATKADSSLAKIRSSSGTAAQSLQNLGRIAQDAPFGFIGIQNNINPLLESFGRLKAETGSTGTALKALAGSLTGAGGLGLAVSVVTSVLTLFAMGVFDSKESAEDLGNEIAALGVDFENAKNQIASFNREIDATKQLRDLNLSLQFKDKELVKIQLGFDKQDAQTKLRELQALEVEAQKQVAETGAIAFEKSSEQMHDLLASNRSLSEVKKDLVKAGKNDVELLDAAIKAEESLRKVQGDIVIQRIQLRALDAQALVDAKKIDEQLAKRKKKIKESDFVLHPHFDLLDITSEFTINDAVRKFNEFASQVAVKIQPIKIPIFIDLDAERLAVELNRLNAELGSILKNTQIDAISSFADSLGESIAGGTNFIKTMFHNLFQVLGAGIEQLGKTMVTLGLAKEAIEKFNFLPGIGTVIAGLATIAFGALLKNFKIPGFADGVTNFGGGLAVVGERGPELVRLPAGSDVIPNHRINGMAAGGQQVFIPSYSIRGQDIVTVYNRATQTNNRNG